MCRGLLMEKRPLVRRSCVATALLLSGALLCALMACGGGGSSPGGPNATLAWTRPVGAAVTGYRVYYGLAPGQYLQPKGAGIEAGPVVTYVVSGLTPGSRYYFAVTAIDDNGNESDYSNEASKLVQ